MSVRGNGFFFREWAVAGASQKNHELGPGFVAEQLARAFSSIQAYIKEERTAGKLPSMSSLQHKHVQSDRT